MNEPRKQRDDPLDELLAEARWPELSPESIQRLTGHYRRLRRARLVWRNISIGLAAAAAVALVAGVSLRPMVQSRDVAERPAATAPAERRPVAIRPPEPSPPHVSAGRAPSALEMILFRAQERRQATSLSASGNDPPDRMQVSLDELVANPSADPAPITRSLIGRDDANEAERWLVDAISRESGDRARAALRLLSEVGSARSLPALVAAAKDPALRTAALPGLIRLADERTLAGLVRVEQDRRTRERLLAALLRREMASALPLFLDFVDDPDPQVRHAALAALDAMGDPPVEGLIAMLDAPRMERRFAAARALGRAAEPETLWRILSWVDRPERRREVLVALLASPDPLAQAALARASHHSALAGLIRHLQQTEPIHVVHESVAQPAL